MRRWRTSSPAACTPLPSTPPRRAKAGFKLPLIPAYAGIQKFGFEKAAPGSPLSRGRAEKLAGLRRLLARKRLDAQRGDAIARAPQHAEAEAVKRKALADFRDRARLVDDQPGDG